MSKFRISRREFVKATGALGAVAATGRFASPAIATPKTIKIGFVTPQTGAAVFEL